MNHQNLKFRVLAWTSVRRKQCDIEPGFYIFWWTFDVHHWHSKIHFLTNLNCILPYMLLCAFQKPMRASSRQRLSNRTSCDGCFEGSIRSSCFGSKSQEKAMASSQKGSQSKSCRTHHNVTLAVTKIHHSILAIMTAVSDVLSHTACHGGDAVSCKHLDQNFETTLSILCQILTVSGEQETRCATLLPPTMF